MTTTTPDRKNRPMYIVIDVVTDLVYGDDPTHRLLRHLEDAAADAGLEQTRKAYAALRDEYVSALAVLLAEASNRLGYEVLFAPGWSTDAAEWCLRNDGVFEPDDFLSAATDVWEEADKDSAAERISADYAYRARFLAEGLGLK